MNNLIGDLGFLSRNFGMIFDLSQRRRYGKGLNVMLIFLKNAKCYSLIADGI